MARNRATAHPAPSACGPHPLPALVRLALPAGAGAPDCSTGQVLPEMAARWAPPRGPGAPFRAGRRRAPPGPSVSPSVGCALRRMPARRSPIGKREPVAATPSVGCSRHLAPCGQGRRQSEQRPPPRWGRQRTQRQATAPAPRHPTQRTESDRQRRALGHVAALGTGADRPSGWAGACTGRPCAGGLLCRSGRLHRPPPYN